MCLAKGNPYYSSMDRGVLVDLSIATNSIHGIINPLYPILSGGTMKRLGFRADVHGADGLVRQAWPDEPTVFPDLSAGHNVVCGLGEGSTERDCSSSMRSRT
jgi:hypothetical protein